MSYMKFKTIEDNVFMATNCPVELDILKVTTITKAGYDDYTTYVVSTARTSDQFGTFDEAVRFAEYKFGVVLESEKYPEGCCV